MIQIILTDEQVITMYEYIEEYYSTTGYGSWVKFKEQEKRNIVTAPLKNGLNMLSLTVLDDAIYTGLKEFILGRMEGELVVREVEQDELIEIEEEF